MKNTKLLLTFSMILLTHGLYAQPGELFNFNRTIQVTPDDDFQSAGFVRVWYVPATNNLVTTFGGAFKHTIESLTAGYAYKEYNLDMQSTGKSGALYFAGGDIGGLMVGNTFYAVNMDPVYGWHIVTFDATGWTKQVDLVFPLDTLTEGAGDMMVAFVNGKLDISSQCLISGQISAPEVGASTFHVFFSPDIEFQEKRILNDTPHITGSMMIYVDGIYYFITATAYTGDVIVMKYDNNWNYLGMKKLINQAHWSEGVAFDGQRFYISYLNTSQRAVPQFFPYYPNVHLAAFDRDWNLVDDVAVTDFTPEDSLFTGRPSLLMRGDRIYVSYDVVPLPEDLSKIEGFVSIYDLNPGFTSLNNHVSNTEGFLLEQNYPDPCNSSTTIGFSLSSPQMTTLKVCDIRGQEVAVLIHEMKQPGRYTVTFNTEDLPDGIYFYRLLSGYFGQTRKLIVLK